MRKIHALLALACAAATACATSTSSVFDAGTAGLGSGAGSLGSGAGGQLGGGTPTGTTAAGSCAPARSCSASCTDFGNGTPISDTTTATGPASNPTSGAPCIVEPGDGALLPNNWVRPRIAWRGGTGPFKITIHSGREANDLVVNTSNTQWTMPKATWLALAGNAWDDGTGSDAISVTVAGASGSSTIKFMIAPAIANGSMVYWTAAGDTAGWAWLEGFGVGDETISKVLTAPTGPYQSAATNVTWTWSRDSGGNLSTTNRDTNTPLTPTGDVQCIGCHVAVPDTNSVAFVDFYPWDGVASSVNPMSQGQVPTWLTPGGAETLSQGGLGMMAFSSGVWAGGNHLVVAASQVAQNATSDPWASIYGDNNPSELIWIDLSTPTPPTFEMNGAVLNSAGSISAAPFYQNQGTTYGFISRSGDSRSASAPAWSHEGTTIVYASNTAPKSGRLDQGDSDLYGVPFDATTKSATGGAEAINGAADSSINEYYPAFSPDDKYLAFNTAPGGGQMYYSPSAEVNVIPAGGGTKTRLAANDPPTCLGATSPGVTNSWPRWSPEHPSCNGKTYYWLIFSSSRLNIPFTINSNAKNFKTGQADGPTSQLYLTALVDDGTGKLTTYPAVYIWNQSTETADGYAQSNHTPAWEVVNIPPPPPPK